MNSITERIDNIIEQRKKQLPAVKAAIARLEESYQQVKAFEEKCSLSLESAETGIPSGEYACIFQKNKKIDNVNSFSFAEFYQAYESYHEKLLQLEARFQREKLHISFVGTAGQGKSLIMQQISGLDGTVIPSATGSDCTGAKSIITNNPSAEKVYAKITFFSKAEIAEIINKYLDEIDQAKTVRRITSLSEVTPQLRTEVENIRDASRGDGAFAGTLLKYIDVVLHGSLNELYDRQNYLVAADDIEEYVAQYSSQNPDIKYDKYLGVKCADIECCFPHSEAGKIVLVDTVGIGANSVGVEEEILHTVKYDSDIIVLMQRPDPIRFRLDAQHSRFAKKIIEAITPECARNTFFWVLNQVQTGNLKNENALSSVRNDILASRMALSDILTLDCSSIEEVESRMIMPILEKLSSGMSMVDEMLISQANACASDAAKSLEKALDILDNVQADSTDDSFGELKEDEIEDIYELNVLGTLRDEIKDKYKKRIRPDETGQIQPYQEFVEKAEQILRQVWTFLPKEEQIVHYLNRGNKFGKDALIYFGDKLRMDVITAFRTLDEVLDMLVRQLKQEVVEVLIDKGRLGCVLPRDAVSSEEWEKEWIEKFLEKVRAESLYPSLYQALTEFKDFTFHVEGFMIYKVRRELEPIDYHEQIRNIPYENAKENREELASLLCTMLEKDMDVVHDNIRLSVKKLYTEPNFALWAAADNLLHRACWLEDNENGISAKKQWIRMYRKWAHEIWYEDYLKSEGNHEAVRTWTETIRRLREYTREGYFEIGKEA